MRRSHHKNDNSDKHPDSRSSKGPRPAVGVIEHGTKEIAYRGADIDTHVKDIVALIFLILKLFLVIEITQKRGDIRFEKAVTDNHKSHGDIQHRKTMDAHHEITGRHK